MPRRAKTFISMMSVCGAALLSLSLWQWRSDSPERFIVFLVLTVTGSAIKVRLPGITGTYSLSFWFLLLAVASLSFSETMILAAAAAVVQVLWKPKARPSVAQVLFNIGNLVVSAAAAYGTHNMLAIPGLQQYELGLLPLTVVVYWTVNTGAVSIVLTLVHNRRLGEIWHHWCFLSLPYYVAGASMAAIVIPAVRNGNWVAAMTVLPFMLLASSWHKIWAERQARP